MFKPAFLKLNRNFLLLWQGQQLSTLGSDLSGVALSLWIVGHTGSPAFSGLMMTADSLPTILILPIAGAICDRWSRKKILIGADLLRGLLFLALGLFLLLGHPGQLLLGVILLHSFSSSVASAFFHPAISSLIPDLVPQEQLAATMAMDQTSTSLSRLLGTSIGGALYQLAGAPLILIGDSLTFFLSGISAMLIKEPAAPPAVPVVKGQLTRQLVSDLKEGGRYLWHFPGMRTYLLATAAIKLCIDPIIIALPFFLKRADSLNAGDHWMGWIMTGLMAGGMAGSWLATFLQTRSRNFGALVMKLMLAQGIGYALLGLAKTPEMVLILFFLIGASFGITNNYVYCATQARLAPEMRGKCTAMITTFIFCLSPLGFSLSGIAVEAAPRLDLLIFACGLLVTGVNFLACREKHFRNFLNSPHPAGEKASALTEEGSTETNRHPSAPGVLTLEPASQAW